tara:strand:- start:3999 stop:9179 length:5181 start_codon:yes stop_codon:yes gene_type:complete
MGYFESVGNQGGSILFGTALGGAVGGVLYTAVGIHGVKKFQRGLDEDLFPSRVGNAPQVVSGRGTSVGNVGSRLVLGADDYTKRKGVLEALNAQADQMTVKTAEARSTLSSTGTTTGNTEEAIAAKKLIEANGEASPLIQGKIEAMEISLRNAKNDLRVDLAKLVEGNTTVAEVMINRLDTDPAFITDTFAGSIKVSALSEATNATDVIERFVVQMKGEHGRRVKQAETKSKAVAKIRGTEPTVAPKITVASKDVKGLTDDLLAEQVDEAKSTLTRREIEDLVKTAGKGQPKANAIRAELDKLHEVINPEVVGLKRQRTQLTNKLKKLNTKVAREAKKPLPPTRAIKSNIDELAEMGQDMLRLEASIKPNYDDMLLTISARLAKGTDSNTQLATRADFPRIAGVMTNNGVIAKLYQPNVKYTNLRTGDIANMPDAATVYDMGKPSIKGTNVIINSKSANGTKLESIDFARTQSVKDLSPMEASARYHVAMTEPNKLLRTYDLNAPQDLTDFPLLNALMIKGDWDTPVVFENFQGKLVTVGSMAQAAKAMRGVKKDMIQYLESKGKYTRSEMNVILDIDPLDGTSFVGSGGLRAAAANRSDQETAGLYSVTAALRAASEASEGTADAAKAGQAIMDEFQSPTWLEVQYNRPFEAGEQVRQGKLVAEQDILVTERAISDFAALHLGNFWEDLVPNHLDSGSTDDIASFMASVDNTNGLLVASEGSFENPLSFMTMTSGDVLANKQKVTTQVVTKAMEATGTIVAKNPQLRAEANVLTNLSRREQLLNPMDGNEYMNKVATETGIADITISDPALASSILRQVQGLIDTVGSSAGVNRYMSIPDELNQYILKETNSLLKSIQSKRANRLKTYGVQTVQELSDSVRKNLDLGTEKALAKFSTRTKTDLDDWHTSRKGSHLSDSIIPVSDAVGDFYRAGSKQSNLDIDPLSQMANIQGTDFNLRKDVLYTGSPDTKKFSHVAFVNYKRQGSLWNKGKRTAILAHSEEALASKMKQARKSLGEDVDSIVTLKENKDFYQNILSEYDYALDMTSEYANSLAGSKKVLADTLIEQDDDIVSSYVHNIIQRKNNLDRKATGMYYHKEINQLERLDQATNRSTAIAGKDKDSAYKQQIKQMLNLPNEQAAGKWLDMQQNASDVISKTWGKFSGLLTTAGKAGDFESINKYMKDAGIPQVYSQAEDYLNLNINAPKPIAEQFVNNANTVVGTLMLRLEHTQSLVNAMSVPIILHGQLDSVKKFIKDPAVLKKWNNATLVTNPDGSKSMSTAKLMQAAVQDMFTPEGKAYMLKLKEQRVVGNMMADQLDAMDSLAKIDYADQGAIKKGIKDTAKWIADNGAKFTLADKSEEFTKFVTARSVKYLLDLTDMSEPLKDSMIRGMVKKVNGNYQHNQRAGLFKGFAGQAIGLFQTYQFNMISRVLGLAGEGNKKALGMMLGWQGSMFGAQSLPGFQALNNHIAGRNPKDHANVYSELNGGDIGEWFLYGAGSNFTKPLLGEGIDLYNRGNLNPRTPILIPSSLDEVPAYSVMKKALTAAVGVASGIAGGAPIAGTLWEGLARNGFNRPIAGLAQLMNGNRTTNQGALVNTYSASFSLPYMTVVAAKLAGTKTMDEAIAVEQYYKALEYKAERYEDVESLGSKLKTTIRDGELQPEQMREFYQDYMETGGNADSFNGWMGRQMDVAKKSNINTLRNSLHSPEGKYLRSTLDYSMDDYTNTGM